MTRDSAWPRLLRSRRGAALNTWLALILLGVALYVASVIAPAQIADYRLKSAWPHIVEDHANLQEMELMKSKLLAKIYGLTKLALTNDNITLERSEKSLFARLHYKRTANILLYGPIHYSFTHETTAYVGSNP